MIIRDAAASDASFPSVRFIYGIDGGFPGGNDGNPSDAGNDPSCQVPVHLEDIMNEKRLWFILPVILLSLIFFNACSPAISKEIRDQVDPNLDFRTLLSAPDSHAGKMVMLSGTIIHAVNQEDGTMLMVLQQPTESSGRPLDGDETGGRFLAKSPDYLDVAVYSEGRQVTIAGLVKGGETKPLGETSYTYPFIEIKEIYLWKPRSPVEFGFGFSYHYGGYYPYRPYWW